MAENQEVSTSQWRIDVWFPDLNPEILKQLKTYHDELLKFNKTLSIISQKTVAMADALHFADSILASRVIAKSNPKIQEIYDLGLGSGFPGLVFAIMNPHIKVHVVESDQRKCEFLKHIIASVRIPNANVFSVKLDEIKENSMQYVMTRGLASISKVIMATRKSVPKGGVIFHLKGEQWGMEVSEIPIQLCSLWTPGLVGEYRLPVGEIKFSVIKTDKIA
ncbi:16S rRNA (guanine(527)-N(7))-methyltransferase RsmG [Bdellovibrio sp. HCB337]|uniref:16S rRNA (guanine(527)-N(7))-methyltransferase RsmG n=1 Tax=Bdellovibrio sp. HCB337 TaxID=3394358 RepID=UPI0039A400D1